MKILIILILNLITYSAVANDSFISATGSKYSEARTTASKIAIYQSMKIVGQYHSIDKNGNWTVVLRVRPFR